VEPHCSEGGCVGLGKGTGDTGAFNEIGWRE